MTRAERLARLESFYAVDGPWAKVDVAERLLMEAEVAGEWARVQRKVAALRLPGVWPWVALVQAVARLARPSFVCVDPDDVGFVPVAEGRPVQLVGGAVQRALGWYAVSRVPTVLRRGAVACGDRPGMPQEFYPSRPGRVEAWQAREVDVEPYDVRLRQAVGRYERLDARLAAGEISVDGHGFAAARVQAETGVSREVADAHSVRVASDEVAQDREMLRWLHRDAFEVASEKVRLARYDDPAERWLAAHDPERQPKKFDRELAVTGMLQGSEEAADRAWLYAKLSQIRTDCSRTSKLSGPKALEGKQRQAAIRLGVSLQQRFVLRRLVEEACERDDREFADAWRKCEEWRRAHGLTYADAVRTVASKLHVDDVERRFAIPAKARNVWREVGRGTVAARKADSEV